MNLTTVVRDVLNTSDYRVTGHIGADHLFADECDHCNTGATVLIEATTSHQRGATREGHIYCVEHAINAIDTLTWASDADEIAVTIPANLAALATFTASLDIAA
ncbi:hypothetical protein [Nocardia xishanensis]|uniref:hypothetical protein n=1 Tax=Nocardia xishanensis TaxID=238964 RepID=UPI00082A5302|nr:hypothetical protein [Nocardia xishanensis]